MMSDNSKAAEQSAHLEQHKQQFNKLMGPGFVMDALKLSPQALQDKYHLRLRAVGAQLMRSNPEVQVALQADGLDANYCAQMANNKVWVDTYFMRAVCDGLGFGFNFTDQHRKQHYPSGSHTDSLNIMRVANEHDKNGHFQFNTSAGQTVNVRDNNNCGPYALIGAMQDHIMTHKKLYAPANSGYSGIMSAMARQPLTANQIEQARAAQQALYNTVAKPSSDRSPNTEQQRLAAIEKIENKELKESAKQQIQEDEDLALEMAVQDVGSGLSP